MYLDELLSGTEVYRVAELCTLLPTQDVYRSNQMSVDMSTNLWHIFLTAGHVEVSECPFGSA